MAIEREVQIGVVYPNRLLSSVVWLEEGVSTAEAVSWCFREIGYLDEWNLVIVNSLDGIRQKGIGFVSKEHAMLFALKFGGSCEKIKGDVHGE